MRMGDEWRGNRNLPKASPSNSSTQMAVLVRHASLRDGTVNYNDEQIPLSAELDDFQAKVEFDSATSKYPGSLGYRQGCVITTDMNRVEHNVRVEFTADRDVAILDPFVISPGQTQLTAHLNIPTFANSAIDRNYEV